MSLKNATKTEAPNRVELEVEVDAAAFEAAVQRAYKKNVRNINVPGFRKGKAPRQFVEKIYGTEVFYEDAMNEVYPTALDEAVKASGYEFVEDKIDLDVVSVGKDGLVFKAVITVKPTIELTAYKGLKAAKKVEKVTQKDIDAELSSMQERQSRLVAVEDRPAAMGDTVVFDFDGYVDDVAFEGGKSDNYTLVLGSGQFIPGFEEQIVGKSLEEAFDVNVTFPEEYHAADLAGKPAVFKCLLHEIKTKELPELNDDFAKDCSEFDTLDALKEDVSKKLAERKEAAANEAFETALIDQLVEAIEGDIPEAMYENRINEIVRDFEYRMQMQGMALAQYLQYTGMDMEGFRAGFRAQAEKQVKLRLALEKVAELEAIEPTEEDLNAEYDKMAEQYNMEADKIKGLIPATELAKDVAVAKAMDVVKENAKKPTAKKAAAKKEAPAEEEKED